MRPFLPAFLALCLAALLAACDRRDLTYGYDNRCDVCLVTDWGALDRHPSGMTAMFYPKAGGKPLTYVTNSVDSVTFAVPVGSYRVLLFNRTVSEFGSLGFRNLDDLSTAEVYALQAAPSWVQREDDAPTTYGLEQIACTVIDDVTLTEEMRHDYGVLNTREQPRSRTSEALIPIYRTRPVCAAYTTTVTIHISGVQNVRSARATMSGLAEGYFLGRGHANSHTVTHVIEDWKVTRDPGSYTEGTLSTAFVSFGMPVAAANGRAEGLELQLESLLQVSLLLVDNTTVVDFHYDVSRRIKVDHTDLRIVVEVGIPVPGEEGEEDPGSQPPVLPDVEDKESSSSGFDAEVSDWEDGGEKDISF